MTLSFSTLLSEDEYLLQKDKNRDLPRSNMKLSIGTSASPWGGDQVPIQYFSTRIRSRSVSMNICRALLGFPFVMASAGLSSPLNHRISVSSRRSYAWRIAMMSIIYTSQSTTWSSGEWEEIINGIEYNHSPRRLLQLLISQDQSILTIVRGGVMWERSI